MTQLLACTLNMIAALMIDEGALEDVYDGAISHKPQDSLIPNTKQLSALNFVPDFVRCESRMRELFGH